MIGVDAYTATKGSLVGIDWLNLASGALRTAGGAATAFETGGGAGALASATGQQAAAQAAAEKARLEAEKKAAEKSARTWKVVGVVGAVGALLGGVVLFRRSKGT